MRRVSFPFLCSYCPERPIILVFRYHVCRDLLGESTGFPSKVYENDTIRQTRCRQSNIISFKERSNSFFELNVFNRSVVLSSESIDDCSDPWPPVSMGYSDYFFGLRCFFLPIFTASSSRSPSPMGERKSSVSRRKPKTSIENTNIGKAIQAHSGISPVFR